MDAQYNIRGTAKAKMADMIEATKAFDEQYRLKDKAIQAADQGAAALQALDEQYQLMDRATIAADSGASVFKQGIDLVILKASEADSKYCITEQAKNKYGELDEMYQITEKAVGARETAEMLKDKQTGCCFCQ